MATENDTNSNEKNNKLDHRPSLHDTQPLYVDRKSYVKPPDGGWGWVIVAAVWIDNVLCIGMLKSLGVLFPALKESFNEGAAAISWINSISLSMRATAAPLSAALSNRFGERKVVGVGGIMVFVGMLISVFATTPYYLYVSLGCIAGLGFALASLPALTMIGRYFNKRRSLANGLSRSGGGGIFFLAPILQMLIEAYGWQGCLLVISALELHLIAVALLLRPVRLKSELEFDPNQTLSRHGSVKPGHIPAGGFKKGFMARRAISAQEQQDKFYSEMEDRVKEYGITESLIVENFPQIEPVYNVKKTRILDFSLLKDPSWMIITFNLVICQMGYSLTLVHLVARARLLGVGEYQAPMLLSCVGLSEIVAQLSSGAFADRGYIKRIHLHKIYQLIMCLATIYSLFCTTFPSLIVYCVLFGCGSGSWQGNILPITIDTLGLTQLRSAYGFCLFFSGVCGQLIGPPIAGALYDATQSYASSFILASCCFFTASVSLFLEPMASNYMKRKRASPAKSPKKTMVDITQSQTINILKQEMQQHA